MKNNLFFLNFRSLWCLKVSINQNLFRFLMSMLYFMLLVSNNKK